MMVRSSTDLPLPEAPTTPTTSPCRTSRSTRSCKTLPPMRVVRPRMRIIGPSDVKAREEDGEGGIDDDHEKDRADNGKGGKPAHAFGASRDAEAGMASDE